MRFDYFEDFMNHMDLSNSANKSPKGWRTSSDFFRVPYTKLRPGEKIKLSKRLQEQYGYVNVNEYLYFNPDTYSLQYYNAERKALSNKIQFKVTPLESIDQSIAEKFVSIIKMQVLD